MTNQTYLKNLRSPTQENPLRILMSSCLAGTLCGYDGSSNGEYPIALKFLKYNNVKIVKFCPEEFSFGVPREMCDIHGGNGMDVLAGKAKVLSESGKDWSQGMINASLKMLEIAQKENIDIAIMMDISSACGSQVIYDGNRFGEDKIYQIGTGVCAAQLLSNGFNVVSQRDFASLDILLSKIDLLHVRNENLFDHHETEWYKTYFSK